MYFDTSKLSIRQLTELRRLEYNRWKPMRAPLLGNELVYFNRAGFFHITHNGQRKFRKEADRRMRLNLLPQARKVIQRANFYGSPNRVVAAEENRTGKEVTYYELTYRYDKTKAVSVIVRKIGTGGQLHFYSIRYYKKSATKKGTL